jgi:hypothetical protein
LCKILSISWIIKHPVKFLSILGFMRLTNPLENFTKSWRFCWWLRAEKQNVIGEIQTLNPQAEAYTTDLTPVMGELFTSRREGWLDARRRQGLSGNAYPIRKFGAPDRPADSALAPTGWPQSISEYERQEPFCVDRKTYAKLSAFVKYVIKFGAEQIPPQTLSLRKNMRRTIKRNTYLIFIFLPYPIPNLDYISHTRFCDDNN